MLEYVIETPALPSVQHHINVEDLISLYQVWNESTSTSPSGLHLGHEKSLLYYKNNPQVQSVTNRIFKIKTLFINLVIKHGLIYDRWHQVNTIMIEKQPNLYHIDKLRALHLFKSDINGVLGILWGRRLIANAEYHHILNDSQHGSRKGRSTDTLLLTKHLTYALWRLTHTKGMTFDNDAKSCYDRIVIVGTKDEKVQMKMNKARLK